MAKDYTEQQQYQADPSTGAAISQKQEPIYGSMPFWKLNMKGFVNVLEKFPDKKIKVLSYILKHTHPSTNEFGGTYREISKACGVSLDTVERVMKLLQDAQFLMKKRNATYFVSPDILMKGTDAKKQMLFANFYRGKWDSQE